VIPFFVADRPASLRNIKGADLPKYDIKAGIMGHANASSNVQQLFRSYPCSDNEICDVIGNPCPHNYNLDYCERGRAIRNKTIMMCDSGIFTKNGCELTYAELFERYERMGVHYGIMIDVLKNAPETIQSAEEGFNEYQKKSRSFNFVAVSQGQTIDEYIECYGKLQEIGFEYIAIGGLLRKHKNTVRYATVRNEQFIYDVIEAIRREFNPNWIYPLGCFNPSRAERFIKLGVWGSDNKGWTFHYVTKTDAIARIESGKQYYRGVSILDGRNPSEIETMTEQQFRFWMVRRFINERVYSRIEQLLKHEFQTTESLQISMF